MRQMGALSQTRKYRKWQAVLRRAESVGGYRDDDHTSAWHAQEKDAGLTK